MILGLFIRNFKTYQGINFIPLSTKYKFCGILGDNGIGKSSILEALDCFFNNREWNVNHVTKKQGSRSSPYIVPIFAIEKDKCPDHLPKQLLTKLDGIFRNINKADINIGSADSSIKDIFVDLHTSIKSNFIEDKYYLFPIGVDKDGKVNLSILESKIKQEVKEDSLENILKGIKSYFDYVYIPKDIDSELFTRLETKEIQILMGESLESTLRDRITEQSVNEINRKLNEFIEQLQDELPGYVYRTPTTRQQNLRKSDINKLIIDAFLNIRKLHKKQGDNFIEINSLSSGEKQKAIIDVAHSLLKNHRKNGKNLIIAIDEPESSLHISACFEQFSNLFDISKDCRQVIFSSHWYGFLPILRESNACFISQKENIHYFDLVDLFNYREQISDQISKSQGKQSYYISLKSISDLSHSIISSIISEKPFNWLICEGSSEKIYFEQYFKDEIKNKNLRIIPVGGAKKIKTLYKILITSYEEIKDSLNSRTIKGKIFLLSDTDSQLVSYDVAEDQNFRCYRIVNDKMKTIIVKIDANPKSPETEIEDCLNGRLFAKTLKEFESDNPELKNILDDREYDEKSAFYSLDLKPSHREILKSFFDKNNGENKLNFAKKYTEILDQLETSYSVPEWINKIKEWFDR